MFKSIVFVLTTAFIGAVLAVLSVRLNIATGWVGALALIGWAILARRNWALVQMRTGLEPSGPERVLRLRTAGTALLLGHLIATLAHPELDIHVGQGNSLAIDSWTMLTALVVASFLFRQDATLRDERDNAITARGTKVGYISLISLLIILLTLLGFLPVYLLESLNYFTLANVLVAIILLSISCKYAVELIGYAKDTEAAHMMGLEND